MKVLQYGTFQEYTTRVVKYDVSRHYSYVKYTEDLYKLRETGCTITPLAFIPEPGTMWLYCGVSADDVGSFSRIRDMPDDESILQIIMSLLNMYRAGYDFDLNTYEKLTTFTKFIVTTTGNVAISTPVEEYGFLTVFNAPYSMIASELFDKPIITRDTNTFVCLKLLPYIIFTVYGRGIDIAGKFIATTTPKHDVELLVREGTYSKEDYVKFAESQLNMAVYNVYGGTIDARRINPDDFVIASTTSIIIFAGDADAEEFES